MKKNLIVLLSLSVLASSCVLVNKSPAKLYARAVEHGPYDAAIVPGVPYNQPGWDRTMKGRVLWSVFLYEKGLVKNLIFSGSSVYSPYVEGKIMALYAEQLGVPHENIFAETQAEHSVENVYYGDRMAKKLGFHKIALVSDPFQTAMVKGFMKRKFKPRIARIPFIIDTLRTIDDVSPVIDPTSANVPEFVSIVERQSFFERFRDTSGRKVRQMIRAERREKRAVKKNSGRTKSEAE